VGLCKFQAQRAFTWEGMLENNINHILGPYLNLLEYFLSIGSPSMSYLNLLEYLLSIGSPFLGFLNFL